MIRRFNRRILNPATLTFAGRRYSPYAVVRHIGHRTGRAYATPVVARRVEEGFLIPLPYGEDADWVRNVRVGRGCTIDWNGGTYEVTEPQVIDSSAALPALPIPRQLVFRLFRIRRFLSVKCPSVLLGEPAVSGE